MKKETLKEIIMKKHAKERAAKKAMASKKAEKVTVAKKETIARRQVMAKATSVYSERLAKKLDSRMEKILFDLESLVKEYFPARYVSASLTKIQKELIKEGISCTFDKRVTKEAIKKTAKSDITCDECDEAVKELVKAVVAETEDTLDSCDKAIKNLAKKHFPKNRLSTARAMRSNVEKAMKETGLNFKF